MKTSTFVQRTAVMLLLAVLPLAVGAVTYEKLAEGVYKNGSTYYICSGVTSLSGLRINASDIYCFAVIPPACDGGTFWSYNTTIHVTQEALATYTSTMYWKEFSAYSADAVEPESVAPFIPSMMPENMVLEVGQSRNCYVYVSPSNATPSGLQWISTNESVATALGNSTIKAVAPGECDIIASCLDKQIQTHVTVPQHDTVMLNREEIDLLPGQTVMMEAACEPLGTEMELTVSDPDVVTARMSGGVIEVTAVRAGTAEISVRPVDVLGTGDKCTVTVYAELGDMNGDGSMDVSDATELISLVLGNEATGTVNPSNGDMNGDGVLDVSDVTQIIGHVLGASSIPPATRIFCVDGCMFKMVLVEGGTFTMGTDDPEAHEYQKPAHEVTLTGHYYIGQTEVTTKLWRTVMREFLDDKYYYISKVAKGWMTWNDCQSFIAKLNEMTGGQFRLLTEAEWEFAARGGNKSQGYMYSGSDIINKVCWYHDNSGVNPYPVALKAANELGIYDMSGNVMEWCQDWYGSYSAGAQTDPTGPQSGEMRVRRGGSCLTASSNCIVRLHSGADPKHGYMDVGLRLAM